MSSQFIKSDLENQMGRVLPAFLPVNGKRLIQAQADHATNEYKRVVTLPRDYEMNQWEERILKELDFEYIRMNHQSLEEVLQNLVLKYKIFNCPLDVLYGDTIVEKIPVNTVAVVKRPHFYTWGEIDVDGRVSDDLVLAGRLHLDCTDELTESLNLHNNVTQSVNALVKNGKIKLYHSNSWLDFGNLETFYMSRRTIFNSRHFNNIENDGKYVTKSSSTEQEKLMNEARWLEEIPRRLRPFCPPVIEVQELGYTIPYIADLSLDELLVHGRLRRIDWQRVFNELLTYFQFAIDSLEKIDWKSSGNERLEDLLFRKVEERVEQFPSFIWGDSHEFGKIKKESLGKSIVQLCNSIEERGVFGLLHGDMVFSNIMWDCLKARITLIDPRAQDRSGGFLQFGDIRYDLGKLYQSIFLYYDWVMAGRKILGENESLDNFSDSEIDFLELLKIDFQNIIVSQLGVTMEDVQNIALLLLISLIPLHNDRPEKQRIFIEIFKRKYQPKS